MKQIPRFTLLQLCHTNIIKADSIAMEIIYFFPKYLYLGTFSSSFKCTRIQFGWCDDQPFPRNRYPPRISRPTITWHGLSESLSKSQLAKASKLGDIIAQRDASKVFKVRRKTIFTDWSLPAVGPNLKPDIVITNSSMKNHQFKSATSPPPHMHTHLPLHHVHRQTSPLTIPPPLHHDHRN